MKKVTIYTSIACPYCVMAKRLLNEKKISFEEIDVTDPDQRADLVKKTGWRTVPQIFIEDELIGGFQELSELDANGELEKRLS